MRFNLPSQLRFAIYLFNGIGSIVVVYLLTKGTVGEAELTAWTALSAFTSTMAGLNVSQKTNVNDLQG